MTEYTDILPDSPLILERNPMDGDCAPRSWEIALLTIDRDGQVALETRSQYGGDGTPMDEWHGRTRVYRLADSRGGACALDMDRLREELAEGGVLSTLIDRIKAGHSVEWNGQNHIGRLTPDAREADEALEYRCGQDDYTDSDREVWGADQWLVGDGHDTPATTLANIDLPLNADDAAIATAAADLTAEAARDGIIIVGDMAAAIRGLIESVNSQDEDEDE